MVLISCNAIVLLSMQCMYRTGGPSVFLGGNSKIDPSSPNARTRAVFICLPFHIVYGGIFVAEGGTWLYLNAASSTEFSQYCGGSIA